MRRIRLTATERAYLEQLFKTTNDRRLRDRCQAIVMAQRGRKRKTIAQDLGGHRTTVRLWRKQYDAQGVEGLQIHGGPRQRGRIPETLAPTIQEWGKAGPQGCGLDRAHWTCEELATYLYQSTGNGLPCGCSGSAMLYVPIARRTAICAAIRRSSKPPGQI